MKRKILITITGVLTVISCCYFGWIYRKPVRPLSSELTIDTTLTSAAVQNRMSVAFILGEDKEDDNPFYKEAELYYRINPQGRTDQVVNTCRSLLEVKRYLKTNSPSNGLPWGIIHLVSHGNQWTGLSVKVTPDSKRATMKRINEHTNSNVFELLDEIVLDGETMVVLHGCGVGNDPKLVEAIRVFFGFTNGFPIIFAPKFFEYYASHTSEKAIRSEHYLSRSWLLTYPMEQKPSNTALVNELRETYPNASVDWYGALSREKPRWIGDDYHYTFEVPVKWVIALDSLPNLEEEKGMVWLNSQPEITDELQRLQIPIEKFKWTFDGGYTEVKPGVKSPAVFVKGYCTMLCVLQVMTDGHDDLVVLQKPFLRPFTDSGFYYSSCSLNVAGL
jgi:hypothetical protein